MLFSSTAQDTDVRAWVVNVLGKEKVGDVGGGIVVVEADVLGEVVLPQITRRMGKSFVQEETSSAVLIEFAFGRRGRGGWWGCLLLFACGFGDGVLDVGWVIGGRVGPVGVEGEVERVGELEFDTEDIDGCRECCEADRDEGTGNRGFVVVLLGVMGWNGSGGFVCGCV